MAIDSIYWTKVTEENYLCEDPDNIEEWFQINVFQLNEITELIGRKLTVPQRKTLVISTARFPW